MTDEPLPLQEIETLIAQIQPLPRRGKGEDIPPTLAWLKRAQQKCRATINHPRITLFCAHHGFAFDDAAQRQNAASLIEAIQEGQGRAHDLCQFANADLRIYEMDLSTPTRNAFEESAMSEEQMVTAMAYGMMAAEKGPDLLAPGAFGAGTNESARALLSLICGAENNELSTAIRERTNNTALNGLAALCETGGFETAALAGMILAARLAATPVLLDSLAGLAALAVLTAHEPALADHCLFAGQAPETVLSWFLDNTSLEIIPPVGGGADPSIEAALQIPQIKALTLLQVNKRHAA